MNMKINLKAAVIAVVPLALAACAGTELGETRGMATTGSAFDTALYEGYVARSEHEYGYGNYSSSDAFALKAQAAAAGETVLPWTPNDSSSHPPGMVPESDLSAMLKGREDLLQAFSDGGRDVAALDAATAQVHYDCWIEEQSYIGDFAEADQPDHAAECRDGFYAALARVQDAIKPAPVAQTNSFLVFFNWDSSTLTDAARAVINAAVAEIRGGNVDDIEIVGHADTSGSSDYNQSLSEARAQRVAAAMTGQGVAQNDIGVFWRGESDPLVSTGDGVREPQNRRVEIILDR